MADFAPISLKASPFKIAELVKLKSERRLHLPDLQRGFVWSPERVRLLHDSLYRRYPVGALLLWKPIWEGGEIPCAVRAWEIFPPDPVTSRGLRETTTDIEPGSLFVLDGQQRLTSIFRVVFQSRQRDRITPDPDLLVALSPDEEWTAAPFYLHSRSIHRRRREGLLVPAEVLFEAPRGGDESAAIRRAVEEWVSPAEDLFFKALDRANAIRTSVLQADIIAYEIDAEAEDDNVIEIFARLNQQGVRLRPGDLAAARLTGKMANFRARARAALGDTTLQDYAVREGTDEGGRGGGIVDTDLLIRASLCLGTGLVRYRDIEKSGQRETSYDSVEQNWDRALSGFAKAVALFRQHGIPNGSWLPYRYLILPPSLAAAEGHAMTPGWIAWAIVASLWRHYAAEVDTKLERDASFGRKGDIDGLLEHVRARANQSDSAIPEVEHFEENIVANRGVHLALLIHFARVQGRSFIGGKLITSADEPLEIHHIFPRALLDSFADRDNDYFADRLGNLTILTRSDNEHLADSAPATYLATISPEDSLSHFVPFDTSLWHPERYADFCRERARLLGQGLRDLLHQLTEQG